MNKPAASHPMLNVPTKEATAGSEEAHTLHKVNISISIAKTLCEAVFKRAGYSDEQANVITDHLVDAELRGHPFAGLARALSITEQLKCANFSVDKIIEVDREGPAYAHLNGHNAVGYLVARRATELAIEKAKNTGVSVVGANGLWYTGNLAYYAEMATREGLIVLIASNGSRIAAPHGSYEPKFCTNPFCIGIPTGDPKKPVIWDIGTTNIMFAQVMLAQRLGVGLPEGSAYDKNGNPTTNPMDVLTGALTCWGGHKGSGLAMMVQLLGIAAGSPEPTPIMGDFGYLVIAFDPSIMGSLEKMRHDIDSFCESVRATKMLPGQEPARMPFERSVDCREEALARGEFLVEEEVLKQLEYIVKA